MTKKIMRSAIDAGFRWSAAHRILREVVERERHWSGGLHSYGYAVNMFANAAKYRDFWERRSFSHSSVHLTPLGTYFAFQGNSGRVDWTGAYVREDGTIGRFQGRHNYPLYCVGCGRADLRVADEFMCTAEFSLPATLLIKIPLKPGGVHQPTERRAEAAWREKARLLEQEHVAKALQVMVPPPPPAPAPRPQPVRQRAVKPRGPVEALLVSVLSSLWGTFKFLLLIVVIGLAAGRK